LSSEEDTGEREARTWEGRPEGSAPPIRYSKRSGARQQRAAWTPSRVREVAQKNRAAPGGDARKLLVVGLGRQKNQSARPR
jgi:hypothetical protein